MPATHRAAPHNSRPHRTASRDRGSADPRVQGCPTACWCCDGAELLHEPIPAGAVAERDQVLTEEGHRAGRVIVELLHRGERHPVATHQLAHWRAGTNFGEAPVLFLREHSYLPSQESSPSLMPGDAP